MCVKLTLLRSKHAQKLIIYLPTYLPWSHPAALLKAAPLSPQYQLESMLFLAQVTLAMGHFMAQVPPFGIP